MGALLIVGTHTTKVTHVAVILPLPDGLDVVLIAITRASYNPSLLSL